MKSNQRGFAALGGLFGLVLILFCGYGWVMNIVKLAHLSFQVFTPELVLRGLGVIAAPLGIVMGYIG